MCCQKVMCGQERDTKCVEQKREQKVLPVHRQQFPKIGQRQQICGGLWAGRRSWVLPAVPGKEQNIAFEAQTRAADILRRSKEFCDLSALAISLYFTCIYKWQPKKKKKLLLSETGSLGESQKPAAIFYLASRSVNICKDLYNLLFINFKLCLSLN